MRLLLTILLALGLGAPALAGSVAFPSEGDVAAPDNATVQSHIMMNPGIFQYDPVNNVINPRCIASGTSYLMPGLNGVYPSCTDTNSPPAASSLNVTIPAPGAGLYFDMAPLGLTQTPGGVSQFSQAEANAANPAVPSTDILKQIGQAVQLGYNSTVGSFEYSINSSLLPTELTYEVPGSGLYMHAMATEPGTPIKYPFKLPTDYLQMLIVLAEPTFVATGSSTANLVLSLSFQQPDTTGVLKPVSFLITLFVSTHTCTEKATTDGRNFYLSGCLSASSSYITTKSPSLLVAPFARQTIGIRITNANMAALIAALNVQLVGLGDTPLSTDLTTVRFHEYDVRTEIGKLDLGTITETLDLWNLSATIVQPSLAN